ncbi:hypothetical protein LPTSP3_g33230 [Leptospira kobayashii]|uniref:Uncharacterized protein n=1 Tax=Leptospira kobayashii TaxID=1917830 RepID=A0ABN6KGP3_9LEPT|nr:hypothetical protein [Leptospira kobayashii]BDA80393.1 hypothetical protein LPTSP3_g33230 [Leptospira kobayashii]
MTPTHAVQSFINAKKEGIEIPSSTLETIRNFRKWREPELIGLRNASSYYPDIYIEKGMEEEITRLLTVVKNRNVAHKF